MRPSAVHAEPRPSHVLSEAIVGGDRDEPLLVDTLDGTTHVRASDNEGCEAWR